MLITLVLTISAQLQADLQAQVTFTRHHALAPSTYKTRLSQWKHYLQFCQRLLVPPLPASTSLLCQYVVFMGRSFRHSTILNYLSAVKYLHRMYGYSCELGNDFLLQMTLKGAKRLTGDKPDRKLPITPELLFRMYLHIDEDNPRDVAFWACLLMGFRCLFRKSNLVPPSKGKFDKTKHLTRQCIQFTVWGAIVSVSWTKTIQYANRILQIPVVSIRGSPLCAVFYLSKHMRINKPSCGEPLFTYSASANQRNVLTYSSFVSHLRRLLERVKNNLVASGVDEAGELHFHPPEESAR